MDQEAVKDAIYMAAFVLMLFLSGEKEKDLRLRLEGERAFSESLAQEADWMTNSLAQAGENKSASKVDSVRATW